MSAIAPTYEEFIVLYPAFESTDEVLVEAALSLSERLLDVSSWEDFFSDAVGLDTAHNLTLDALANTSTMGGFKAAAGVISSVSAAGVSTSFAAPDMVQGSKTDSWYSKTVYGQKFLLLRDNVLGLGEMTC